MGSWDTVRWAGQWAGHASPSPPPDSSLASVAQLSAESVLEVVRWCVLVMAARVACHGRGITRVTCHVLQSHTRQLSRYECLYQGLMHLLQAGDGWPG